MPRTRQKRAARLIIENETLDKKLSDGEIVANSGYGPSMQKNPGVVLNSAGVKEALADYGFNPDNAKQVVAEILLDSETDKNTRLNAAKEVFKVFGEYAPEKKIVGSFNLNDEHREKARNAIKNIAS